MTFSRLLYGSLLACAAFSGRAVAQDKDVTLEEQSSLVVSGFAVGVGTYDRNLGQNTATGSKIALSLFRPWSDQLYLFGQLTTHLEVHDSEPAPTHIEIDNLIVNWTPARVSALTLSFGRFDAPIGYERDDEPLNLIPTPSFTFENARPVKFTGLMARYALNPRITLLGLVANGWNQEADNNSGKTAGLKVQLFPASGAAVAFGALYGPEEDSTNGSQRTLLTADATWQPLPRLILQAEAHRGSQPGVTWTGVVGQAFWRAGQSTGLTVRGEVLDDPDGATTGTPQTLRSLTISPWYFYREAQEGVFSNVEFTTFRLPAFSLRPAVRIDHSSQPVFEAKDGSLKRSNLTALVELVYVF
jgi:hypothetical protein